MTVCLIPGPKSRPLESSLSAEEPWYVNDHTLTQDIEGRWHVFGVSHPKPARPLGDDFPARSRLGPHRRGVERARSRYARPTQIGEPHVWAP